MSSNPYPLRKVVEKEYHDDGPEGRHANLKLECGHTMVRILPKNTPSGAVVQMPLRVRCDSCEPRANAGSEKGKKRKKKLTGWRAVYQRWMDRITNFRRSN